MPKEIKILRDDSGVYKPEPPEWRDGTDVDVQNQPKTSKMAKRQPLTENLQKELNNP